MKWEIQVKKQKLYIGDAPKGLLTEATISKHSLIKVTATHEKEYLRHP